jgi:hypothetical protein
MVRFHSGSPTTYVFKYNSVPRVSTGHVDTHDNNIKGQLEDNGDTSVVADYNTRPQPQYLKGILKVTETLCSEHTHGDDQEKRSKYATENL